MNTFGAHNRGILPIPDDAASVPDHFGALKNAVVNRTNKHELLDRIALSLSAIICGVDGWIAVKQFALRRESGSAPGLVRRELG